MQDELACAHSAMVSMREHWFEVFEDLQKEFEQKLKEAEHQLKKMEERALRAEQQRDEALDKMKELRLQFYQTASELEKEKGINQKLRAQLNRDFENSSIPSSKSNKPKKIACSWSSVSSNGNISSNSVCQTVSGQNRYPCLACLFA